MAYDLAAVDDRGVYAVTYDDGSPAAREFAASVLADGHEIRRLPRGEATALLVARLSATWPEFAALSPQPATPIDPRGAPQPDPTPKGE